MSLSNAFNAASRIFLPAKRTKNTVYNVAALSGAHYVLSMDRLSLTGARAKFMFRFGIDDDFFNLLEVAFMFSYTMTMLLFGYLGDRYSRRVLVICCVTLWSLAALSEMFMSLYWLFFFSRFFAGIGQAGFSVAAPTMLVDLVSAQKRSLVLAVFYSAIPVGSTAGFLLTHELTSYTEEWWIGIGVAPLLGILGVVAIVFIDDAKPGEREAHAVMRGARPLPHSTSFSEDFIYLLRNIAFVLLTGGYTCICYVSAGMRWWMPTMLKIMPYKLPDNAIVVFAIFVVAGGALGITLTTLFSYGSRNCGFAADPIICGCCIVLSAPLLGASIMLFHDLPNWMTYIMLLFGLMTLNMNWALAADILMYVVAHTHRCTAIAAQLFVSQALGAGLSPYIVGLMLETAMKDSGGAGVPNLYYNTLRLSLLYVLFAAFIGAAFYWGASCFVMRSRRAARQMLLAP